MAKLTKRFLDTLTPRSDGDLFAWDSELRGFGVRMKPSGAASLILFNIERHRAGHGAWPSRRSEPSRQTKPVVEHGSY